MCVCVSNIVELSNWFKLQLQFFTSLPFNYISPSVCLSVRVDWPDQACCASISPSKGPRSFVQLDSWWTLVHSGDLRRSQATVIAVMAWNQLNMFWTCLIISYVRSCIASQCMRERERVRVQGVLHCFQTAFCTWLQLFWEYSCYLLLSLATAGLSETLTLLLITDDLLDHLSAC